MASSLKKAKVKLDLLTDIDILLMVKKGVSGVICHAIFLCVKDRLWWKKESSHLNYWNVNNLYGWEMSQNLTSSSFNWFEETS